MFRYGLRCFSCSSLKRASINDILKKVPQEGRVNLIGEDGKANIGVSLRDGIKLKRGQTLQVVNFKPTEEGKDPILSVKVVKSTVKREEPAPSPNGKPLREKKQKPTKPAQTKDVVISWNISKNDLDGPKRKSIESILGRGHRLRLKLESRDRSLLSRDLTPAELEARQKLLERINAILEENGVQWMKPDGSIGRKLMLFYKAKEAN